MEKIKKINIFVYGNEDVQFAESSLLISNNIVRGMKVKKSIIK